MKLAHRSASARASSVVSSTGSGSTDLVAGPWIAGCMLPAAEVLGVETLDNDDWRPEAGTIAPDEAGAGGVRMDELGDNRCGDMSKSKICRIFF